MKKTNLLTRILLVALACVLTMTLFTACNGDTPNVTDDPNNEQNENKDPEKTAEWLKYEDPAIDGVTLKYYVCADAEANGDGSREKPFLTIPEARDAIRSYKAANPDHVGGIAVYIFPGKYTLTESIVFSAEDSGSEESPIYYVSVVPQGALINGGTTLDTSGLTQYAENIYVLDLKAIGVEESYWNRLNPYGAVSWDHVGDTGILPEFFLNRERLVLARYPNEGFTTITNVVDEGDMGTYRGATIGYSEDIAARIETWANPEDAWVGGFFKYDWCDSYMGVSSYDKEAKTLTTEWPMSYGARLDGRFYFFNVFEELDYEGECYFDREQGLLYIYTEMAPEEISIDMSVANFDLISANNLNYVTFDGLDITESRNCGIVVRSSNYCTITNCRVSLTYMAAVVLDGYNNKLTNNLVTNTAYNAVCFSGGEQLTLTPGNGIMTNNVIRYTGEVTRSYASGLDLSGVGLTVSNNTFYGMPHQAIAYGTNDNIIEYNEIYDVCLMCGDCGAIYTCGNYMGYGNILRYNYIHDVGGNRNNANTAGYNLRAGIYWDNLWSGQIAYGNIFVNVAGASFEIGGGRDHTVYNNIFVNSGTIRYDDRGYEGIFSNDWYGNALVPGRGEYEMFKLRPYTEGIWAEKYPALAQVVYEYEGLNKLDTRIAVHPAGSVIYDNAYYGDNEMEYEIAKRTKRESQVAQPIWIQGYNDFTNKDAGNYNLKPDAEVFSTFENFDIVDLTKVGANLQID